MNIFSFNPLGFLFLGSLFVEAAAVGVVCAVFMILMVISGIRQVMKNKDDAE